MNSKVDDLDHFATQTPQQNIVKAPKKKKNAKYMKSVSLRDNYNISNKQRKLGLWVLNITSNDISVISWWIVLLMEETGVPW